jgi:VRR-NUC domain
MRPEDRLQKQIVDYLNAVLVAPAFVAAIPNASRRTAAGRAGNAVPGLKKGMPDLVVAAPLKRTLWLEVKTPTGRMSAEQKEVQAVLRDMSHAHEVVRSIEDVKRALIAWGVPFRGNTVL